MSWSSFWTWFEIQSDYVKAEIWKQNNFKSLIEAIPIALAEEMLGDSPQYVKDIWNNHQDELERQQPKGMLRFLEKEI